MAHQETPPRTPPQQTATLFPDAPLDGLQSLETDLLREIETSIARLEVAHPDDASREHLELLRTTVCAHVRAYLGYAAGRRSRLSPHTSLMYADSLHTPGVIATDLRGLLDAGTLVGEQGARLVSFLGERRTLLFFGEPRTGKSTLLNALFELISVDERFVAIDAGVPLPALRDRSFCVHLSVDADADLPALFAKARRMNPSRLVVDDLRAETLHELIGMLAATPLTAGMGTMQATSIGNALESIAGAFGGDTHHARQLIAGVRPVFIHMRRNSRNAPQVAALWSVEGSTNGELILKELETASSPAHGLLAEV